MYKIASRGYRGEVYKKRTGSSEGIRLPALGIGGGGGRRLFFTAKADFANRLFFTAKADFANAPSLASSLALVVSRLR